MARKRSKALGTAQSMTPAMPIADVLDASAFGIEDIVTTPSSIPKPTLQMPFASGAAPTLQLPSFGDVSAKVHDDNVLANQMADGREAAAKSRWAVNQADGDVVSGLRKTYAQIDSDNEVRVAEDAERDAGRRSAWSRIEANDKANKSSGFGSFVRQEDAVDTADEKLAESKKLDKAMQVMGAQADSAAAEAAHQDAARQAATKKASTQKIQEATDASATSSIETEATRRAEDKAAEARMMDWGAKTGAPQSNPYEELVAGSGDIRSDLENWGAQTPQPERNLYEEQAEKEIESSKKRNAGRRKILEDRASKLYLGGGFKNASRQWDAMDAFDKANMMRTGKAYGQALENIKKSGTENAATNNMVASLKAAKEAGVADGEIFSGGKQLGSDLARQMGLKKSAGKQLSKDLETAKNAMTTLEAEQKRAHKAYDGIIEAVGDKKKWASMTNAQKAGAIGMHAKQAIRLNESMSGRFGRAKSLFGKVVDRIGSVKTAIANRGQGLSLRQEAAMSYHSRQLRRAKKAINSNEKLGSALDAIGRRKAARGERVIGATDKAIEDLKARNDRSAQMINDIKNGKSARGVVQRANPEMMKRTVAEGPKGGKGLGWKSKAGAVAALLGVGAVLGNMMGNHGEQSNAQLYNPNPQPQYAN